MSRYYRRSEPEPGDNLRAGLLAGVLAGGVAVVSFYLTRLFLTREPLEPLVSDGGPEKPAEADEGSER
jgi:hypothetical protein